MSAPLPHPIGGRDWLARRLAAVRALHESNPPWWTAGLVALRERWWVDEHDQLREVADVDVPAGMF